MSGGGVRVPIPANVSKMIQNIKEITGNHSEDEIYAMLKECSMDPNETAQKLLLQDTFHEVKRKRDKKKENTNNRESGDSRRKPSTQGRGGRGGRGNFSSRYPSHDASGGKKAGPTQENTSNQVVEKGAPSSSASQERSKETSPSASYAGAVTSGATGEASGSTIEIHGSPSLPRGVSQSEVASSQMFVDKLGSKVASINAEKNPNVPFDTSSSCNDSAPVTASLLSTVSSSSPDPVLVSSNDSRLPGIVGNAKREVGSNRLGSEPNAVASSERSASKIGTPFMQGKVPNKSHVGKDQLSDSSKTLPASGHGSSGSRPSSNYSNRSQQVIGQKVGAAKEWKPKPVNANVLQGSGTMGSSDVTSIPIEASVQSQNVLNVLDSQEATSKLQKKLEELHLPQRQHVIIPNHIHVPESERTKLSFGSFDVSFGARTSFIGATESDKSPTPVSETSQGVDGSPEEQTTSIQETLTTAEERAYPDPPHSGSHATENLSGDADISSSAAPEYNESKPENALLSEGQQYTVVQTSPSYSFGFVPPMLSGQIAPFENSEPQARDVSRSSSFVVQQPFDPASYYAQFFRSGADSDGRVSPFPSPAVAAKYNGNVAVLPPHAPQSQEGGNPLMLSTAGPTPLATQAAGLMQSSIAATQQTLPIFRPPTGLHIPHYPPNYFPYGHYFSPIYVPPQGIPQFLSNGSFPQQPQPGGVYPAPQAAAAAMGVKYSLPQYKPGANVGNSAHVAMAGGYGPHGSSGAGYNPGSAATGGNSASNEDLSASAFKESNIYMGGQQSEGSGVWVGAPGREISSLPVSSFYNLPPQGQHMTFTPTQGGHGTFYQPPQAVTAAGVHPFLQQSQPMAGAIDMVGPAPSVYQPPQHQQTNWPSNY